MVAFLKSALVIAGLSGLTASSTLTPQQIAWYRAQLVSSAPQQAPASIGADPLADSLVRWKQLRQSSNYGFDSYADFLLAHPNWPSENLLRKSAEQALQRSPASPSKEVAFFKRYPPQSDDAAVIYAEALKATGAIDAAREQARDAWTTRILSSDGEARLLSAFGGLFKPIDYDMRMDMLLWRGATSSATRIDAYLSPLNRPVLDARLALLTNAADATTRDASIHGGDRENPGFIAARATWLLNTHRVADARSYLAQRHHLSAPPSQPLVWMKLLRTAANGSAADGRWQQAYDIASQLGDTYAPGTNLTAQPYAEKDVYTDLAWLAGQAAFDHLDQPAKAQAMFDLYSQPFDSPQTRPRGLFWAGRAATKAGNSVAANAYFQRAAQYQDAFYGQLSAERLGLTLSPPAAAPTAPVAGSERAAFYAREPVRAAQMLGTFGNWQDQSIFLRQIAANATSPGDHRLGIELSRALNRPDLAVMISRSALQNGLDDYVAAGYPEVPIPSGLDSYWTIIHAIARQESQFDRQIVSRAGAVGLMQLMPGTARETAQRMGLSYSPAALTDPSYNARLGTNYFERLFDRYGSYPLAIAAYNAGPGNVNKWLTANGDPRSGAIDMIDWIEGIPFGETRGYVQRVLENAVVYGLLYPNHSQRASRQAPLDWYLGRRPGGNQR